MFRSGMTTVDRSKLTLTPPYDDPCGLFLAGISLGRDKNLQLVLSEILPPGFDVTICRGGTTVHIRNIPREICERVLYLEGKFVNRKV